MIITLLNCIALKVLCDCLDLNAAVAEVLHKPERAADQPNRSWRHPQRG
jgi:hypothetical protein